MAKRMKKTHTWYKKIFDQEMREGRDIINKRGELLILEEGDEFRQCYAPEDIDPIRSELPWSWFVSRKGDLISVTMEGKLEWLLKIDDGNGYYKYKYIHPKTNKIKNIMVHTLVGLVFGSKRFGKTDKIFAEKGVYSFGRRDNPLNINGHHIKSNKSFEEDCFNPDNIEFMTVQTHDLLHSAPGENASPEERIEYMSKLSDIAEKEAPGKIVVFSVGDEKRVEDVDHIYLSQEAMNQIVGILNGYKKLVASNIKE